jgi:hypothetical protein
MAKGYVAAFAIVKECASRRSLHDVAANMSPSRISVQKPCLSAISTKADEDDGGWLSPPST